MSRGNVPAWARKRQEEMRRERPHDKTYFGEGSWQWMLSRGLLHAGISSVLTIGMSVALGPAGFFVGKLAATAVLATFVAENERKDIKRGQPKRKAVTDMVSWLAPVWLLPV